MLLAFPGSVFYKKIFVILIALFALGLPNQAQTSLVKDISISKNKYNVHSWTGSINSKIPVFMWLIRKDSLIQGEVVYTKTKNKIPIKLIGQIDREGKIKVGEYLTDGTISGIFYFDNMNVSPAGKWSSTQNFKEVDFKLSPKDTLLPDIDTSFQPKAITGDYAYMYGKDGYQGGISIRKVDSNKVSFEIGSVTDAPARNSAEISLDTVSLTNNTFVYKLRKSKDCSFKVTFYKHFLVISYLKGYGDCGNFFGLDATVDGIFYKLPNK